MEERTFSVLLLEDIASVSRRMAKIVESHPRMRLLPLCPTVAAAREVLDHHSVDVMVADLQLPDGSGTDVIRALRAMNPEAVVIVMSVLNDAPAVLEAIRAGATGYLAKDDDSIGVLDAIEMAMDGKSPMSAAIARLIVQSLQDMPGAAPGGAEGNVRLTPREAEVLNALARGYSNREVGEILGISPQTVPVHTRNIYRKLEASNKSEAVFIARQHGLID